VANTARPRAWTVEDFLAFEAGEMERYEFVGGVVRTATGGTAAHSAIKGNVAFALDEALRRGSCRALLSDLKVLTPTAVLYPDVLVTCRPLAPDDDRLSDPTAVVEVLSPASETFDRIYKWREYQRIAALRHYVLIEQKERRIEVWSRTEAGWALEIVEPPDDELVLEAIDAGPSLDAIYENSGR
jgi:Uma2 family endonuclease